MPELQELEPARVQRFLKLSAFVHILEVHAQPDHWVDWTYLHRLLPLIESATDERTVLMPHVKEAWLTVYDWNRRPFAPFVRLFANPSLHTLVVDRWSNSVYTPLSALDSAEVFRLAGRGINPGNKHNCYISIYPDDGPDYSREFLAELLPPPFTSLTNLSVSAWMISESAILAFARYPLVRLAIYGRLAARSADLGQLHELDIPEGSFDDLRELVLSNIHFYDIIQLLRTPRLTGAVSSLKLDLALIGALYVEDDEEDDVYMTLVDQVIEAKNLKKLMIVSSRDDTQSPYCLTPLMVEKLRSLHLFHLRLYNFTVGDGVGFDTLRDNAAVAWANMSHLSMLSQDLLPGDLVALSRLPKLWRLAANVSPSLGEEFCDAIGEGFSQRLHLVSRFRFGVEFRSSSQRRPPEHCKALYRMLMLLTDLCPSGLIIHFEREFSADNWADRRDHFWLEKLMSGLRNCGTLKGNKLTPELIGRADADL
ncbi:hypothetical protein FRC12_005469 [Ceratobasidium sp. 428]|nr:hypothetical protein FRC12_005469 [Ceratobasidium sp. 428]